MKSDKKVLQQRRGIRRAFWVGQLEHKVAINQIRATGLSYDQAKEFVEDSSNLDAEAKRLAHQVAIPFDIPLCVVHH